MKKLIAGVLEFRKTVLPGYKEKFRELSLGQKPDTLFIACSDSRVVPNLFASTNPGDLFVSRNVGNLIPAHVDSPALATHDSTLAALEFAVLSLDITDIVVCGHSECGAMQALCDNTSLPRLPNLEAWLSHAQAAWDKLAAYPSLGQGLATHNRLSQANVLVQIDHIAGYPCVKERLANETLRLHSWWFDIGNADVLVFEETKRAFVAIDESRESGV